MASAQVISNGTNGVLSRRSVHAKTNGVIPNGEAIRQVGEKSGTQNAANNKSAQALVEVRQKFLEYADQNPDKVNKRDRDKLATDDWYLKRYLLARNRRVNDTLDMLRKTMEWRNEFGIHISEDAMFPLEFYKIGALFPYENDKNGNLVLYMRIKYHRKINEMVEVEKHFLVHTFEKIDRITNGQGLVIIFDCQGAGLANADIDFLRFLISCAIDHAPVGLQYIVVYKLPWVLNAFWNIVKKFLPPYLASRVRFCDEKSIREFIEPDHLPDFMNGTCQRNYRWVPPGSPSIFKLANAHGITDDEINKILPQFQPLLDEAEEWLARNSPQDPPDTITRYINNADTAPSLLSDLALCKIGLIAQSQAASSDVLNHAPEADPAQPGVIRVFPDKFIEFNYLSHGSVTIFNPSETNSLAFKLMSNRPSSYSVKPARGVLLPNTTLTISIILLGNHEARDKFLILAMPLHGTVSSITNAQFDSLWAPGSPNEGRPSRPLYTTIKLGTTQNAIQTIARNPQFNELMVNCRSLRRRQDLSILINIIFLIIIINLLCFNN